MFQRIYIYIIFMLLCALTLFILFFYFLYFISFFFLFAEFTWCLRLKEVRIPNHTVRDTTARLECHYDLDGEALYSVKWYKDGNEFYRYVPRDDPPVQIFPLQGVRIDVSIFYYRFYCLDISVKIWHLNGDSNRYQLAANTHIANKCFTHLLFWKKPYSVDDF